MALKIDIRGMVWKYPEPYVVGHEQIRQYANAVKSNDATSHSLEAAQAAGHEALIAPPTFMSIFAVMIQRHFFQHIDLGFETLQIVQVDQKFHFHRPIKAGDELEGTLYVVSRRRTLRRRHRHHPQRPDRPARRAGHGVVHHADGPRAATTRSRPAGIPRRGRWCASPSCTTMTTVDVADEPAPAGTD